MLGINGVASIKALHGLPILSANPLPPLFVRMPHSLKSPQFSVASPARRSDSQERIREHPWFTGRSTNTSDDGGNGNSCSRGDEDEGEGLADSGLDFLGTTDSVRDLLHLPYTRQAVP